MNIQAEADDKKPHFTLGEPALDLDEVLNDLETPNPDAPRVVFKGSLILTRDAEDKLCERALKRFGDLDTELGRSDTMMGDNGVPMCLQRQMVNENGVRERKFFHKRLLYSMMAENDYSWRPLLDPNSIFAVSNLVVPINRRIATQMTARAINYFFGSEPWLKVDGVGVADDKLGKALQRFTDAKLLQNQNQDRIRRSVGNAFNLGESLMKVTFTRKSSFFRRRDTVLVDQNGNPQLAQDGKPITPKDVWMEVAMDDAGTMATVLKRDGKTVKPAMMNFAEVLLDEEIEHYRGPEAKLIYYRDFMAPLNAETLQDADTTVHVMNYTANALAADYMENPGESLEDLQAAIEQIRKAIRNTPEGKAATTYRPELGDQQQAVSGTSVMEVAEFCIRFDADGDGYEEDILLVMDIASKTPIFYEYMGGMTSNGLRPIYPVVPRPVNGRWYGQGAYEYFESYQQTIDLLANRRNQSQSAAGRVTFWNPRATVEGEGNRDLALNWGKTYTLREGKKPEDALALVYLDDNKYEKLTEDIQFFLQLALNESGVQHANDGNMAGMETTKLATGIRNIEKSAQEMFSTYISELEGGLGAVASAFVHCLFANMEDEETLLFFEGDVPQELTVAARDVRHLEFNVQVMLTRYKDEQMLQSCAQSIMVVKEFYANPPPLQGILAGMYVNMLTALQVKNAERYIQPQTFSVPLTGSGGTPQAPQKDGNEAAPNL